ncbi:nuclear transport factor 2 family protein [Nonomuraea sp. NN258]|uniref:YybH family protein n=1 Tax=Nonomuraea antri TaxID=2730852 RepID=UPI00156967B1|nr:nuclear transport factor 2 family protein [Nonomuraea antri]NRQ37272.1 nuclear transport factor 2 family protein [Nonomuraea antri]
MAEPKPWIDGYVRAWDSNDPDDIGALFTEDALYRTEPYSTPWQGRDEIVSSWLGRKDRPGEWTFEWHPVSVTDEVSVIQGVTTYPDKTYSNLWVIRFAPDGRCHEFTEWWMRHDAK